jgi:hypothetical protein
MKTIRLLTALLLLPAALFAAAEKNAGPKGGRLLAAEPHAAEFFVNADRRIELNFLDPAQKPVAPTTQVVAVIAELPAGKTPLALEKSAAGFISTAPLPAGDPYRLVVQIRASADARPKNFRIDLNLANCGECQHAEYACTCAGH